MKKEIHPTNYRSVFFQDLNNGATFITKSTATTDETIEVDGVSYPLVKVHVSSASHPFFTGQEKLVDIEGRVDKFKARVEAAKTLKSNSKAKATKTPKPERSDKVEKIGNLKSSAS
jgi:large subunit ribosomal protein L31